MIRLRFIASFTALMACIPMLPTWSAEQHDYDDYEGMEKASYEPWLASQIETARAVKIHSSRVNFLKVFSEETGGSTGARGRFVLKSCPLIWVEASFRFLDAQPHDLPHEPIDEPIVITLSPLHLDYSVKLYFLTEAEKWLTQRIDEGRSIKVGMSRAQLLERFSEDGGLQRIPASRYVLKSCQLIKIDATFDTTGKPVDCETEIFRDHFQSLDYDSGKLACIGILEAARRKHDHTPAKRPIASDADLAIVTLSNLYVEFPDFD